MSSMFKKKGGLAFKPKAPVARARPSAPTAAKPTPTPTPTPAPQSAIEVPPETTLEIQTQTQTQTQIQAETEAEATEKEAPTRPVRRRDSQAPVGEEPKEKQKESPAESRRTTRRASHSQHSDTASAPPIPPTGTANEATQSDEATELNTVAVISAEVVPQPEATTPGSRTRRQSTAKPKPPSRASIETSADKSTPSTEEATAPEPTESLDQSQNAPPADSAEEPAVISAPKPAPKRATRKSSATVAGNATPDGEAVQGESSRPRKRQRRTTQQGNGESRTPATRKRKTSAPNANASRSSSRRARSITPDDAETQLVDLQKLKMSDLTKDLRIGKKFSRHDELRERERKARSKAKLEKDGETPSEAGDDSTNNNGKTSQLPAPDGTRAKSRTSTGGASASNPAATSGPQFRIVDGQIVVDQDSLVMDRHARAAAAQAGENMETIEENDFTHLITSSSFMNTSKLKGPNIWTEPETELFYRGLRMFGTEFEMISKMFPGKQRRHVKLKFNREERHNPERIDAAVMGEKTIKMDIDEYRAFTGAEFESVEAIEAEQRKMQEGYEAERQRVADEQAEIMRKKREELFADDDDQGGAGKKKKGKRKGKQAVSYGLNGEPIVQEG
ncbi:hypothetical protein EsDP_00001076 [Epichloe bromicola]|uniref:Myb-like domain-containing protein n=1 Tax=Epichloe bromicola TaxID=79588 RepID=A0ABQ0CGS8_9HYPO